MPMTTKKATQRLHYLDNGRALASILGIFFHSACVFSRQWIVSADTSMLSQTLWAFSQLLSYCRMPLFLFVAGYFTMYGLRKYNVSTYMKLRSRRILLPFVLSVVTLIPVQEYFKSKQLYGDQWRRYIGNFFNPASPEFTLEHLWFLYFILVFSLLMVAFCWMERHRLIPPVAKYFMNWVHRSLPVTIAFWASLQVLLQYFGHAVALRLDAHGAWLDLGEMGNTLPMFLFGCYCFAHRGQMDAMFRADWQRYAAVFGLFALLFPIRVYLTEGGVAPSWGVVVTFDSLLRWLLTIGVLGLLRLRLNETNGTLTYFSDASYPVYLFHQPIIVAVAYYLVNSSLPFSTWTGFALVMTGSLVFTYLAYEILVRRNRVGAFLYTGLSIRPRRRRIVRERQTVVSRSA